MLTALYHTVASARWPGCSSHFRSSFDFAPGARPPRRSHPWFLQLAMHAVWVRADMPSWFRSACHSWRTRYESDRSCSIQNRHAHLLRPRFTFRAVLKPILWTRISSAPSELDGSECTTYCCACSTCLATRFEYLNTICCYRFFGNKLLLLKPALSRCVPKRSRSTPVDIDFFTHVHLWHSFWCSLVPGCRSRWQSVSGRCTSVRAR